MARAVDFPGSNFTFRAPEGREDICDLRTFINGTLVASAWELDDEELAEVIRTRRVFMSTMTGDRYFPTFVGSETQVRTMMVEYGPTWARPTDAGRHCHQLQKEVFNAICDPGALAGMKGDGRSLWGWIADAVMSVLVHRPAQDSAPCAE